MDCRTSTSTNLIGTDAPKNDASTRASAAAASWARPPARRWRRSSAASRALRAQAPAQAGPKATADAVIVLWMAGGMAQTETFDPKRYTPFAPGVHDQGRAEHVSDDRHRRRPHQVHAGARADRQRHRSRHGDPDVQRRRSRLHPALAASVSLAHRLHPAAADGDAAPRRGDLEDARPEESGRAGVHRDRADGRGRRRDRHAQGVSHRGLPRLRARAVPDRRSAGRRVGRAAAEGARRRALPEPARALREAARRRSRSTSTAATSSASRSCSRSTPPIGC